MHRSTLRFMLAGISLLFLLLFLLPEGRAQVERKYTVITGTGEALYRLAIPPVQDGGGAKGAAKTATSVLVTGPQTWTIAPSKAVCISAAVWNRTSRSTINALCISSDTARGMLTGSGSGSSPLATRVNVSTCVPG